LEFDASGVVYNNMSNSNKKMCIRGRRIREGDAGEFIGITKFVPIWFPEQGYHNFV